MLMFKASNQPPYSECTLQIRVADGFGRSWLLAVVVAKENGCKVALCSTLNHSHCQRGVGGWSWNDTMKTNTARRFSWSLGLTFPYINSDTVKDKVWERQSLCLANCWLTSICEGYKTSYLSLTSCFVVGDVFSCKDTADGETPSAASLLEGGLAGSLPQIFSCLKNLGIPSAPSHQTLVFFSLLSAVGKARKTFSLPRNSTEFQQKGKDGNAGKT